MDHEQRVAEIRQREVGATLGPWLPEHGMFGTMLTAGRKYLDPLNVASVPSRHDANFIAAAREDIPWLLDRLRAAEARVAEAEADLAKIKEARP